MSEFKITGLGEYRTRDGRKAVVKGNNNGGSYCWQGKIGEEYYDWTEYGSYWNKGIISINDIIGPWEEPATVTTVLEYKGITKKPSDVLTWLEFVQIMHTPDSPASTLSSPPKAEKQSEACDEDGDAVRALEVALYDEELTGKLDKRYCRILISALQTQGFSIVRLNDTRNGCYNTRTEKDVD